MSTRAAPKPLGQTQWWRLRDEQAFVEVSVSESVHLLSLALANADADFILVWVERKAGEVTIQDRTIENWVVHSVASSQSIIRAGLRTISVIWTANRAILFAPEEHLADAQDAIMRFTLLEKRTRGLELDIAAMWPDLVKHIPLLHAVSPSDLKKQDEVNQATEKAHHMVLTQIRADNEFQQLAQHLAPTSKRLFAELCHQTQLEKRLEAISVPIDNAVDHYETINYRMVDERHAHTGKWIEILIVVVLLAELALNLFEHFNLFGSIR